MKNRLLTKCEQAGKLLCRNWNTLTFLHTEEELADIHIQLNVQVIVAVNVNAVERWSREPQ